MKSFAILALTAIAGVFAAPAGDLEARQLGGSTANDFLRYGCKGVIMIYARASTEPGNIGSSVGPILQSGLGSRYRNNFAMQGVDYPADLASNFLPDGTLPSAITTMQNLLTKAANDCPNAKIAAGGYSQGTAVTAGAISRLPANIRNRIGAVVLFGYTKNLQNRGGIPNFPSNKLKVYCAVGDLVCTGTLIITLSHFTYLNDASGAVTFIANRLG
ncbi:hypothetical protein EX30DRAFT_361640 [Ascodesmis nigricans]|uniref:cutinase n=1 Tax=Ascodesmis nigricans TaxID=341454 RepID=A0A4V3SJD7_9PEZI|nr:hypothetical protein EX30DRAFT_361640 [Ascodesmis nigricans]